MAADAAQRLVGKFIDSDSLEPVREDGGCFVEFFMEACLDPLLTEGGELDKKHSKVQEIRRLEKEALALVRSQEPFAEEEPQPPAKDAPPAALRSYQEAHAEWDERRLQHDAGLKERCTLLRDHHEYKDIFVVSPAGRPIYVDREYIRIVVPGDKDNMPVRPVRPEDVESYREQYNRFKAGVAQALVGTPLEQWPGVTRSQVKELAYFNIRTVEELASVNDANLSKIGPYTAIRRKAKDWLATARGAAPIEEARAESARLRDELKELKRQMAEVAEAQAQHGKGGRQARP